MRSYLKEKVAAPVENTTVVIFCTDPVSAKVGTNFADKRRDHVWYGGPTLFCEVA
jgi:translation elongation factor EF-1alpha